MKTMFRSVVILMSAAALTFAAAPAIAQQQSIPAQANLNNVVWFGGASIDLSHARIVDITPGNQKITDALGVVHDGYFMGPNVFANTPAYKDYIRNYPGGNLFYNGAAMTSPTCPSGSTRLPWIFGGFTDLIGDQCSLKNAFTQWARNN